MMTNSEAIILEPFEDSLGIRIMPRSLKNVMDSINSYIRTDFFEYLLMETSGWSEDRRGIRRWPLRCYYVSPYASVVRPDFHCIKWTNRRVEEVISNCYGAILLAAGDRNSAWISFMELYAVVQGLDNGNLRSISTSQRLHSNGYQSVLEADSADVALLDIGESYEPGRDLQTMSQYKQFEFFHRYYFCS
ncbi:hypothetical protein Trydic_g8692 [Trypoxylus dichotomus]